jgi:hypothetical protein
MTETWSSSDHRPEIDQLRLNLWDAIDTHPDWMVQSVAIIEFVGRWMVETQKKHGGYNLDGMMLANIRRMFRDEQRLEMSQAVIVLPDQTAP